MKFTKECIERRKKRARFIRKLANVIIYIILIPVIIFNLVLIVKAANDSNKIPSVAGIKTFVIISGSMEPELQIGDIVVVKETAQEELQIGDIISYRGGQSIITHRINNVMVSEDGKIKYETKGDNNNATDRTYVEFEDVEGKVSYKIPYLGKVTFLLKNKITIIVVLIIFYILYLHNVNVEERRILRKEKRRILRDKYM